MFGGSGHTSFWLSGKSDQLICIDAPLVCAVFCEVFERIVLNELSEEGFPFGKTG